MGLFKKKDKVIDLTGYYEKNKDKFDNLPENKPKVDYQEIPLRASGKTSQEYKIDTSSNSGSSGGFFGNFFGGGSSTSSSNSSTAPNIIPESIQGIPGSESINPEERRRKLAKRLSEMTSKIEELSNQIYHLQQRLEVIERKLDVNRF